MFINGSQGQSAKKTSRMSSSTKNNMYARGKGTKNKNNILVTWYILECLQKEKLSKNSKQ